MNTSLPSDSSDPPADVAERASTSPDAEALMSKDGPTPTMAESSAPLTAPDVHAASSGAAEDEVQALRRTARSRSFLLPGAGLATLGHPRRALWVAAPSIVLMLALLSLVFAPTSWGLGVLAFSTLIVLAASAHEVRAVQHLPVGGSRPAMQGRSFRLLLMGQLLVIVLLAWACLANLGFFLVRGDSMSPAIREGETLLFSRFRPAAGVRHEYIVAYHAGPQSPFELGQPALGRVAAVPGDQLSTDGTSYLVNGRPVCRVRGEQFPPEWQPPAAPQTMEVPPGRYFVYSDDRLHDCDWVAESQLISSRMLLFGAQGLGVEVGPRAAAGHKP